MALDCLLVHSPKTGNRHEQLGAIWSGMIPPMGITALADLLEQSGFTTRLVHLGLAVMSEDPPRKTPCQALEEILAQHAPALVGISLHWHHQAWDALEAARLTRRVLPKAVVVLGGLTASAFPQEILANHPQVDAVVMGDGEEPLLALARLVCKPGRIRPQELAAHGKAADNLPRTLPLEDAIPGLWTRNHSGAPVFAPPLPVSPARFSNMNFFCPQLWLHPLELLRDRLWLPPVYPAAVKNIEAQKRLRPISAIHFAQVGRGCSYRCTWCGGGGDATRRLAGRHQPQLRPPQKVAAEVAQAFEAGYRTLYLGYHPGQPAETWYRDLFTQLRGIGMGGKLAAHFECWSPPAGELVMDFGQVFPGQDSVITCSLETRNEELRRRHRSPAFSDDDLYRLLAQAGAVGVGVDLFFAAGLPGQDAEEVLASLEWGLDLQARNDTIEEVLCFVMEMEPGSPWFEDPDTYRIRTTRSTLADFIRAHDPSNGSVELGYVIPGFFGDSPVDGVEFARRMARLLSPYLDPLDGIVHPPG